MDISTMRGLVRQDLKDEDSDNYRWTNDEIDRAITRAVTELSRYAARPIKTTIATTDDSREIDISALTDRISVDQVEFPIDEHPRIFQRFTVYQDTLTLIGAYEGDGEDCYIEWTQVHTLDGDGSSIPTYLEDLVALGAAGFAASAASQYHTDRANAGGDNVDRDYLYWATGRLMDFRKQLKQLRKNRKLRTSTFYTGDYE